MPNRILKESIRTSKSVNAMSDFQFRIWAYLITYVDDYGRGSADPELLKGFVFPRRKGVTEATIQKALADLANTGSVILYEVGGDPYLCFPNWGDHQIVRNKVSKFPSPEEGKLIFASNCMQLNAIECNCKQMFPESNPIQNPGSRIQNPESDTRTRVEGDFDTFWSNYPRKEGKEKARSAFAKVKVSLDVMLNALDRQKKSNQWRKENGRFIPHAATWLNGKRWEDDLTPAVPNGAAGGLGEAEIEAIKQLMKEE